MDHPLTGTRVAGGICKVGITYHSNASWNQCNLHHVSHRLYTMYETWNTTPAVAHHSQCSCSTCKVYCRATLKLSRKVISWITSTCVIWLLVGFKFLYSALPCASITGELFYLALAWSFYKFCTGTDWGWSLCSQVEETAIHKTLSIKRFPHGPIRSAYPLTMVV